MLAESNFKKKKFKSIQKKNRFCKNGYLKKILHFSSFVYYISIQFVHTEIYYYKVPKTQ